MEKLLSLFLFVFFIAACGGGEQPYTGQNTDAVPVHELLRQEQSPREFKANTSSQTFYGYWDSAKAPSDAPANIFKGYLVPNEFEGVDGDKIVMISGFSPDDSEEDIRKRLTYRKPLIKALENVRFNILMDEPYYKGFSKEKLEQILQIAKEVMPDQKFAYTFARANMRRYELPAGTDYAGLNFYPWQHEEAYPGLYRQNNTKSNFFNYLDETLNRGKRTLGDPKIFIVGQSIISDSKYRLPEDTDMLEWYMDYIEENNLAGILWYEYNSRHDWKGAKDVPELYEKQIDMFNNRFGNP